MNTTAMPGLERKNRDLMQRHLKTLKDDQRKREESPEIAAACKEAGRWVYERGKGKKYLFL